MDPINRLAMGFSNTARRKRASLFRDHFAIDRHTRILDIGSENGSNIYAVLHDAPYDPKNVYIADIDSSLVEIGASKYGFTPVKISEAEQIPFDDGFFDIVYCSSVIEHVTVPKQQVWLLYSGREFRDKSFDRQQVFAGEVRRLGKQYFVQTPYKYFLVESHSWLPFINWLPRRALIPLLRITNRFWVKKTSPDWHLLNLRQMTSLFPDAKIVSEKSFGLRKSMMAIKKTVNGADEFARGIN